MFRTQLACILAVLTLTSPVWAQDMTSTFGVRLGAGLSTTELDGSLGLLESTPVAGGVAWQFDLSFSLVEVDLLYRRYTVSSAPGVDSVLEHILAIPLMIKMDIPGTVFQAGVGIEPRLVMSIVDDGNADRDDFEDVVWYAPASIGGTLELDGFTLDIEARFETQFSNHFDGPLDDESRVHQIMVYVGGFF